MANAIATRKKAVFKNKMHDMLLIARERGLLSGGKSHVVRGRMPASLVKEAKLRTGISSDTQLIEAALASLAVSDDYGLWLFEHTGTVDPNLDLEF